MGVFGTIVLGYLVGSMLTFGPIMFILGAIVTVTFVAGYIEADNTTYLIIYSLSTAFAIWGYRIKDSKYLPSHIKKVTGSIFQWMRGRKCEIPIEKLIHELGSDYAIKEGSVPYIVDYNSIRINEHGFYPNVTREKAKRVIFKEIKKDGLLIFIITFSSLFVLLGKTLDYFSDALGIPMPNESDKLYIVFVLGILVSISGGLAYLIDYLVKKNVVTEEDISLNYRKYKEKVMEIAKEAYQKEAEQKQKEMIAAREQARKEKAEKDKKAKEAKLTKQRKAEKEKQEKEEYEKEIKSLKSSIMKSDRGK